MAVIRDSLPGEAPTLEALQRRATDLWDEYRDELAARPYAIAVPRDWIDDGRVRVAVDDEERVVGFAVTIEDVLDGVYVDPAAMGTGVGRLLVDDALDRARASGLGSLTVTANPNARPFYEKVGFVATGEMSTSFGPGHRMRIALRD